jgi:hypothetical protein
MRVLLLLLLLLWRLWLRLRRRRIVRCSPATLGTCCCRAGNNDGSISSLQHLQPLLLNVLQHLQQQLPLGRLLQDRHNPRALRGGSGSRVAAAAPRCLGCPPSCWCISCAAATSSSGSSSPASLLASCFGPVRLLLG